MSHTYTRTWIDPQFDKSKPIMFDTETGLAPFGKPFGGNTRLVQIAQGGKCFIYDTYYINIEEVKAYLKDTHLVAHNILYDLSCLNFQHFEPKAMDDTLLMARHVLPFLDSFSLKSVLRFYKLDKGDEGASDWDTVLTEEQLSYAADDVLLLEQVYKKLIEAKEFFTYKLDMKNVLYALRYQLVGLPIDNNNRKKEVRRARKDLKAVEKQLPADLNINSPKQVKEFINEDDSSALTLIRAAVKDGNNNAQLILDARKAKKQLQFLEEKFDRPRIYGFFRPSGAKSGRWTCKAMEGANPDSQNLQQLPRDLKSVFGYSDDRWLVDADYTALEIHTIAGVMNEPKIADILASGTDMHYYTASMLYNKPVEEISKEERQIAKGLNFSLGYGGGAEMARDFLLKLTGIYKEVEEIAELRTKWLDTFPAIKAYHQDKGKLLKSKEVQKNGYAVIQTPLGRPIRANGYTEAINLACQSVGADCTKIAIHLLYQRIPNVRIVNTVHDSITLECMSEEEAHEQGKILAECMDESWRTVSPFLEITDMTMKTQYDVVKNLGEAG